MSEVVVDVQATEAGLIRHVAEWLVNRIAQSQGRFSIAVSGGATPKPLYELLASPAFADRIDWTRIHLFWGDERFVPHDHPDSNYLMVKRALIDHVPIPAENVLPVDTAGHPQDAARDYAARLQSFYGARQLDPSRPLFDVNLMGVGDDGHTASLFPKTRELDETAEWVVSVVGQKPEARITLTYPTLASAKDLIVLVAGASKKTIMRRVLEGDRQLPAARLYAHGTLTWFLDSAAAPGNVSPE